MANARDFVRWDDLDLEALLIEYTDDDFDVLEQRYLLRAIFNVSPKTSKSHFWLYTLDRVCTFNNLYYMVKICIG